MPSTMKPSPCLPGCIAPHSKWTTCRPKKMESRSVLRRKAIQRGEPAPRFDDDGDAQKALKVIAEMTEADCPVCHGVGHGSVAAIAAMKGKESE